MEAIAHFIQVALACLFVGYLLKYWYRKSGLSFRNSLQYPLSETARWALTDKEMRNRIAITLGIALLSQAIYFIPIFGIYGAPGFDPELHFRLQERLIGELPFPSAFHLRLTPLISACFLLQIASACIPPLQRLGLSKGQNRRMLATWTLGLTLILALVNAFPIALAYKAAFQVDMPAYALTATLTMAGAFCLLLLLAKLIDSYGIGSGVAIITVSGIWRTFAPYAADVVEQVKGQELSIGSIMIIIAVLILIIYSLFRLTSGTFHITGNDTPGFRLSRTGIASIGMATFFLGLPQIIFQLAAPSPFSTMFQRIFYSNERWYIYLGIEVILVIIFTFLYSFVVYDRDGDTGLPFPPTKVITIAAVLIASLPLAPLLLEFMFSDIIPFFEVSSLIILSGVLYDTVVQAEFYRMKAASEVAEWGLYQTVTEEAEAESVQRHLHANGIPALIKPYRYTWGLPVKTFMDEYHVYVPSEKIIKE